MDGFKRDNPFLDDEFIREVNKKVLTNPTGYTVAPQEEFKTPALNCTLLHIGSLQLTSL